MTYFNRKHQTLINLSNFETIYIQRFDDLWVVVAAKQDNGYQHTEFVATFKTEQEAITELEYIAQEMNK